MTMTDARRPNRARALRRGRAAADGDHPPRGSSAPDDDDGRRPVDPDGRGAADGAEPPQGPPAPDDESSTGGAGGNTNHAYPHAPAPESAPSASESALSASGPAPSASEPALAIQVNALQAMCRQVFGFRLAMIALAAPAALLNANPGLGTRLVGAAVVVTFMVSYALFRDWERFGPLLLRHPTLLAADTLFGSLLLISAGPDTTLAYVSVCTPLLAGIAYSWRGAAVFASLQSLILLLAQTALPHSDTTPADTLLLPGFCVITGAVGSTLRNLLLRFGTATQALTAIRARLAVTEAISEERARLAREMHDSVAKTLHGVALAAEGLATSAAATTPDPALLKQQAELVARAARRAATESRELLTDLRSEQPESTDVLEELAVRTAEFATRTTLPTTYRPPTRPHPAPAIPQPVARQLLSITEEAMENAHRHAEATRIDVSAELEDGRLRISVRDDGRGLPADTTLDDLRRTGHFGLVGMVERAASAGAHLHLGEGPHAQGTEVLLELPLPPPGPAR
ncbi:sensor histidine kinase [Streptomyces griseorubiginosus]|uniref:sensor histidine kinase n=1 Tax=Streptomyces griseorubiginosus TaxID=67304 RepID=UPI0036B35CFA